MIDYMDTGVEFPSSKKLPTKKEWDATCGEDVTRGADRVGVWLVDSLKIRIPLHKVTIHHGGLNAMVGRVVLSTGEVLNESMETSIRSDVDGVRTAFTICQESLDGKRMGMFLTILVNAKMLGRSYFDGVNAESVRTIYDYLMDLNVVVFTYEAFMDGECVDVDVRKDFQCSDDAVGSAMERLKKNYIHREKMDTGVLLFKTGKRVTGIQFNKRTTTSFLTSPFMKIYNKQADAMDSKHYVFFKHHGIKVPHDLWRVEYTIKNKKHLRYLGMGNKLMDILATSQDVLDGGMEQITSALFNPRQRICERLESLDIPPRDKMMVNALATIADCGKSIHDAKQSILGNLEGYNRTKNAKYLNILHESYLRPIERFNAYDKIDMVLDVIAYRF